MTARPSIPERQDRRWRAPVLLLSILCVFAMAGACGGDSAEDSDLAVSTVDQADSDSDGGPTTSSSSTTARPPTSTTTTTVFQPDVRLSPTDDIAARVQGEPEGTSFSFAAGIYRASIEPKSGQSFVGEPGAILDGADIEVYAFFGGGDDVTIRGLEIRNYANPIQTGAINAQIGVDDDPPTAKQGRRWTLTDLDVHRNNGGGINISEAGVVRDVKVHHNGQIGITSHNGDDILVEDCEVYNNNTDGNDADFEAGGSKFKYGDRLTVRNCHFHDNAGYGIWTDIDNNEVLIEDNLVENETHTCIFQEIGGSAIIRNNVVRGCGTASDPWMRRAGIRVNNSTDVTIEGNTVEDSYNGIAIIFDEGRSADWPLDRIQVRGNTVRNSGQTGLVTDVPGEDVTQRDVVFADNTYEHGLPSFEGQLDLAQDTENARNTWRFRWGDQQLTPSEWEAIGNQ